MSDPADRPPLRALAPADAPRSMRCPECNAEAAWSVCYTRPVPNGVRRVRLCRVCGRRVVTIERIVGNPAEAKSYTGDNDPYTGGRVLPGSSASPESEAADPLDCDSEHL